MRRVNFVIAIMLDAHLHKNQSYIFSWPPAWDNRRESRFPRCFKEQHGYEMMQFNPIYYTVQLFHPLFQLASSRNNNMCVAVNVQWKAGRSEKYQLFTCIKTWGDEVNLNSNKSNIDQEHPRVRKCFWHSLWSSVWSSRSCWELFYRTVCRVKAEHVR